VDQLVEQHAMLTAVSAQKGRWLVRRTPQEIFNVGSDMETLFTAEGQRKFTNEATNHALAGFFAMLPTENEDHLRNKRELDKMYKLARAKAKMLVADAAIIRQNPIICLVSPDVYGCRHFRSGPLVKAFSKVMGKAGKNTGLYQKTSFFCEKTALSFFVFFSPFSRGRCAEPVRAFWVNFCVFNGKFRQYFRNFHYLFYRFRNY
jgi:hypothetical protein